MTTVGRSSVDGASSAPAGAGGGVDTDGGASEGSGDDGGGASAGGGADPDGPAGGGASAGAGAPGGERVDALAVPVPARGAAACPPPATSPDVALARAGPRD